LRNVIAVDLLNRNTAVSAVFDKRFLKVISYFAYSVLETVVQYNINQHEKHADTAYCFHVGL